MEDVRNLIEAYRPRWIRFLDVWEVAGWRMKVYGISYEADGPPPALVAAAQDLLHREIPNLEGAHYGVGFVGVHAGREANVAFIDWWTNENELHHMIFGTPDGQTAPLVPLSRHEMTACVWDLALIGFERDAWIASVLHNADGPDIEGYLKARMHALV